MEAELIEPKTCLFDIQATAELPADALISVKYARIKMPDAT